MRKLKTKKANSSLDTLDRIKKVFVIIFLMVMTYSVLSITLYAINLMKTIDQVLQRMDKRTEIATTQLALFLEQSEKKLDSRLNLIQDKTFKSVDRALTITNETINDLKTVEDNLNNLLITTNNTISDLNKNSNKLFDNTNITISNLNASIQNLDKNVSNFNQYMNCEVNDLCLPNLIQDSMLGVRNVIQDSNKTFLLLNESIPTYNKNFLEITENTNKIAGHIEKLTRPKWYDRVISSLIAGAAVYASTK